MNPTLEDIDVSRLETYLAAELGAEVADIDVVQRGINLTMTISTTSRENAYILQRPNSDRETDYFNGLGREYAMLQRLRGTAVPAPEPVCFCDDASIVGDQFFVVERLDGTAVPWGESLPERYQNTAARAAISEYLVETLGEVHTLDVERFEDVCHERSPAERVERAVDRLGWATETTGHELPLLWDVADWLRANVPEATTTAFVHGDYKPDNILVTGDHPRLSGVIDWETATLGDPSTDLGFLLFFWREDDDQTPSIDQLAAAHPNNDAVERLRVTNDRGFWPFTSESGSFTRRELVAAYERHTRNTFEHDRFYRVLAPFTVATVWEAFHRRWTESGRESHWELMVEYVAAIADSIVRGELEL